jgi:RHS repeat-associated protein
MRMSFKQLLITLLFLAQGALLKAGIESTTVSRAGVLNAPIAQNAVLTLSDQWYPFPGNWQSLFRVKEANANVVLRYDDSKRTFTNKAWTLDVTYTVNAWDATNPNPTAYTGEILKITYDPREGISYNDLDMRRYNNVNRAQLTITQVSYNEWTPAGSTTQTVTNGTSLPAWLNDVYLDLELHIERYYNLTASPLPSVGITTTPQLNEIEVAWSFIEGAESYDLEWLFIDAGDDIPPFTNNGNGYEINWNNATRVNLHEQHYPIALAYPQGILLIRVRGVGIDWNAYTTTGVLMRGEGLWTSQGTTTNTLTYTGLRYTLNNGLYAGMNWAYNISFAEDGKRAENAAFYDGLMRPRTAVAFDNVNNNAIVGTAIYDFEGRASIGVAPFPTQDLGVVNYAGNAAYTRDMFDADAAVNNPAPMFGTPSGDYFAQGGGGAGQDQYTADAQGYPYSRVVYMTDGTSRPATSASMGDEHRMGSGREVQFYYGTPLQQEIDRIFGNEVGPAVHYKKNFVVDPNGQTSVVYVDMHGRTIATALAGDAPANLISLDNPNSNPMTAVPLQADLLVNNQIEQSGAMESMQTLTVPVTTTYNFAYTLSSAQCPSLPCYPVAKTCIYDIEITITNTRTQQPAMAPIVATAVSTGNYIFPVTLTPGTYKVVKRLVLNADNLAQIREDYINYQRNNPVTACVPVVSPNPLLCAPDCHTACEQHYKKPNPQGGFTYVGDDGVPLANQGSGANDPGPQLIALCQQQLCTSPQVPDICTEKKNAMLSDMSPGGQYFDNLPLQYTYNATLNIYQPTPGWNRDNWLDAHAHKTAMLTAINNYNNSQSNPTSYTTWAQIRQNWNPDWADVLLPYHPEYCAWNYNCNWSCTWLPEGSSNPVTVTATDEFTYTQLSLQTPEGDYNEQANDRDFWNPLQMGTDNSPGSNATSFNPLFLPYNSPGINPDPRFAGSCDVTICDNPAGSGAQVLQNYLINFLPVYTSSNTFIGYYNIWYVITDPHNIRNGNSSLSATTVNVFKTLHGDAANNIPGLISNTPAPGQVTPYQYFRSVYWYYRNLVIEMGYAGNVATSACSTSYAPAVPARDADGYLVPVNNPNTQTPEGFTIYYPRPDFLQIYGNGCNIPTTSVLTNNVTTVVSNAVSTYTTTITVPQEAGCACDNLEAFIESRSLTTASDQDIANQLNLEFAPATPYTAANVAAWKAECALTSPDQANLTAQNFPAIMVCSFPVAPADAANALLQDCLEENGELANYNAQELYETRLQEAADAYMADYRNQCMNTLATREAFTANYTLKEYYYTLYYYDQAGNLVKTVPPEGVNLITSPADLAQVKAYRAGAPGSVYTPAVHDMKSIAEYNSLDQILRTRSNERGQSAGYESGEASFWYDYLGRAVVTQNSRQAAMSPPGYSYVVSDALGRITESGELQTSVPLSKEDARQSNAYYYYSYNHTVSPTLVENWIATAPVKREVSRLYYDAPMPGLPADVAIQFSGGQQNLRNRVSSVVYDDDPTQTSTLYPGYTVAGQSAYLHAEHYSYDVHGNIVTSVQETPALKTHNQHIKKTTYKYDLISGNVYEVHYQSGSFDQFHYRYTYDANNRLVRSLSSRDGVVYEKDVKNVYPVFSGAGRVELGEKIVQGVDVVSTLHGGLKAMNRAVIGNYGEYTERDIGKDGFASTANANQNVGADAAGFTLLYWKKNGTTEADYNPVNGSYGGVNYFEAGLSGSNYASNITDQYNGNIAAMTTAMLGVNQQAQEVQGRAFNYDQLYRLKENRVWHMTGGNATSNDWGATTTDGRYHERFRYDWNGNITNVERWGNQVVAGQAVKMDELTYHYLANSNVLQKITEGGAIQNCTYSGDLDNQNVATNYTYDPLGSLVSDLSERITAMEWNSGGKLKAVRKDQTANMDPCNTAQELGDADVEYLYTVSGQRLCKIVKPHKAGGLGLEGQEKWEYYWYTYESSGIPMAIYKQTYEAQQNAWKVKFEVEEHNLFGSGRVGVRHGDELGKTWQTFTATVANGQFTNLSYTGANLQPLITHYERRYGAKQYELSNHLGNVLATVSDKRLVYSASPSTATVVDRYLADVLSYSDYYAFGMAQVGRVGGEYRYGFNGMEMDKEPKGGAGLSYTTEFRQYDPRVGRWFSPDEVVKVFESPYAGMASNPILYADPSGLDATDWVEKGGKVYFDENIHSQDDCKNGEKYMGKTVEHIAIYNFEHGGGQGYWANGNSDGSITVYKQLPELVCEGGEIAEMEARVREEVAKEKAAYDEAEARYSNRAEAEYRATAPRGLYLALNCGGKALPRSAITARAHEMEYEAYKFSCEYMNTQENPGLNRQQALFWTSPRLSKMGNPWSRGYGLQAPMIDPTDMGAGILWGSLRSVSVKTATTTVYRVQRSGNFLNLDAANNVVFNPNGGYGKTVYMFVGDKAGALRYAAGKPGSLITAFEVNSRYASTILKLKHPQSFGLKSISAADAHVLGGYYRIGVHSNKIYGFLKWQVPGSGRIITP